MCGSRQRGRTDIILEVIYRDTGGLFGGSSSPIAVPERNLASATTITAIESFAYLSSPSGKRERCWKLPTQQDILVGAAQEGFDAEVAFWVNRVGKVSPQWPLEILPTVAGSKEEWRRP